MEDYFNPFPPVGYRRVWSNEYIENRKNSIDYKIKWNKLGKLVSANVDNISACPGIYAFVVKYPRIDELPVTLDEVLYIGKSLNIKKRFAEYISDRNKVVRKSKLKSNVRDNIRVLFSEYENTIEAYYAEAPPDRIANLEDIYIQILDPILNSSQKLDEDKFISYENSIDASFESVEEAFIEKTHIDEDITTQKTDLSFTSALGTPEDAF